MKKIGVLFGMENTFPGALVERINSMAGGRRGDGEALPVRRDRGPDLA
jgi:hypothetical protein